MFSAFRRVPRQLTLTLTGALLLTLALPLAAFAQSAQTVMMTISVNGDAAPASFHSLDSTGCIETDVVVVAGSGTVIVNGSTSEQEINVDISQLNQCTGATLLQASGTSTNIALLQISSDLSSATATGIVQLFDTASMSSFNVSVNLAWQGIGKLQHTHTHVTVRTPGFVAILDATALMRNATATGSVADVANGGNFTPNPSVGATLDSSASVQVSVQLPT